MQYGHRITRHQPSMRAIFVLGGTVLMVIVGLLGMHTFSAESTRHGTASISHAAVATIYPDSGISEAISGTSTECNTACNVSTDPGRDPLDMVNGCVLALLIGVLLLAPPILKHWLSPLLWNSARLWHLTATSVIPRAPSLTFLSISRT